MAYFIQMECEAPDDVREAVGRGRAYSQCHSDAGDGPGVKVKRATALLKAARQLQTEAKEVGWTYSRTSGWLCPGCTAYRAKMAQFEVTHGR